MEVLEEKTDNKGSELMYEDCIKFSKDSVSGLKKLISLCESHSLEESLQSANHESVALFEEYSSSITDSVNLFIHFLNTKGYPEEGEKMKIVCSETMSAAYTSLNQMSEGSVRNLHTKSEQFAAVLFQALEIADSVPVAKSDISPPAKEQTTSKVKTPEKTPNVSFDNNSNNNSGSSSPLFRAEKARIRRLSTRPPINNRNNPKVELSSGSASSSEFDDIKFTSKSKRSSLGNEPKFTSKLPIDDVLNLSDTKSPVQKISFKIAPPEHDKQYRTSIDKTPLKSVAQSAVNIVEDITNLMPEFGPIWEGHTVGQKNNLIQIIMNKIQTSVIEYNSSDYRESRSGVSIQETDQLYNQLLDIKSEFSKATLQLINDATHDTHNSSEVALLTTTVSRFYSACVSALEVSKFSVFNKITKLTHETYAEKRKTRSYDQNRTMTSMNLSPVHQVGPNLASFGNSKRAILGRKTTVSYALRKTEDDTLTKSDDIPTYENSPKKKRFLRKNVEEINIRDPNKGVKNDTKPNLMGVPPRLAPEFTEFIAKSLETAIEQIISAPIRGKLDYQLIASASLTVQSPKWVEDCLMLQIKANFKALRSLSTQVLFAIKSLATTSHFVSSSSSINELSTATFFFLMAAIKCTISEVQNLLQSVETVRYIIVNFKEFVPKDKYQSIDPAHVHKAANKNIWDCYEDPEHIRMKSTNGKEKPQILGASLNHLVAILTSDTDLDSHFVNTFLTTYQSFTTPALLFQKLLERWNLPQRNGNIDESRFIPIKLRVGVLLKHWIELHFYDFDSDLLSDVQNFLYEQMQDDPEQSKLAELLKNELLKKMDANRKTILDNCVVLSLANEPRTKSSPLELFTEFSASEIARQLCLVDFELFSSIKPSELLNLSWSKSKLKYRATNAISMISRTNQIAFWACSLILWQKNVSERARMVEKLISVAYHLRKMGNFNALMSIVSSFGASAVYRLKHTFAEVSEDSLLKFEELKFLMDSEGSYKTYRETLQTSSLPLIPYFGLELTDLTFIEDGNPDNLDDLINFHKRSLIYRVISRLQSFQQEPYRFPLLEPLYSLVTELTASNEVDLYSLSLLREPRNSERSSLP